MQPKIFHLLVFIFMLVQPASAQNYSKLNSLGNYTAQVYYSNGHEERAIATAKRVDNAMLYFQQMLGFKPSVTLLILNTEDWQKYTSKMVYGMAHYNEHTNTLFVAAEDNPFWKSFLPPLTQLPPDLREPIKNAYSTENGEISMQAFFDLLAIHELGHAYHFQGGLNMQRRWLGEFFPNILLHSYTAENEPAMLPALTLFPKMVIASGTKEFTFTKLQELEDRYEELGQVYPKNYGWYQCRWHKAAAEVYDSSGKQVVKKLWDALKIQRENLADKELLNFLDKHADKNIGDIMRYWDRDSIK